MPGVRGKRGFVKKSVFERTLKGTATLVKVHEKRREEKMKKAKVAEKIATLAVAGRRMMELQTIAQEMWCNVCDTSLSFRFLEEEKRKGLATIFFIRCHLCLAVKEVNSDSLVLDPKGGRPLYAINCKAAVGK